VVAAATIGSSAELTRVSADDVPVVPVSAAAPSPISLVTPAVASSPALSGNGQFVVYVSEPGGGAEQGRDRSVWVTDRLSGDATELTLPRDGTRLGNSVNPAISADGCTVVVTSETAYDLFRDEDEGSRWDIYEMTLPSCGGTIGDWELISTNVDADGQAQARNDVDPTERSAVSSGGSVIAYVRPFESLSGNEDPDRPAAAIDVVDLSIPIDAAERITPVPGLPTEAAGNSVDYLGQGSPTLSADGSTVVFVSDASAQLAVADWVAPIGAASTVATQVFAWDRNDLDPFTAVTVVSTTGSEPGNASSDSPTVSSDGTVVAFSSLATDLVAAEALVQCGVNCPAQVYVYDRDADDNGIAVSGIADAAELTSMSLVSQAVGIVGDPIVIGNGASFAPAISGDGISLAFASKATNLLQVQTPGGGELEDGDLLIADLSNNNQIRRAFESLTPAAAAHGHPHLAANGRVMIADSLVAGELLGDADITGRHIVAATYRPTISIAALDMGTGLVGVPGSEWSINLVNLGPGAFTPSAVSVDNPDFAISGGSCRDGAPVKPGTYCSVLLILTPSLPGAVVANLTVAESGFDALVLATPIKGAGGEPALSANPDTADYGSEVVGTVSPFTEIFTVTSVSPLPTWVASATMSGANPSDFIFTASTCGVELLFGATCDVEVSFRPGGSGRRTATLSFTTSAGQYTSVLLSGEGVYTPTLMSSETLTPGADLGVGGSGFPANTGLVLSWSDGSGRTALLTTNDKGDFLTILPTSRSQRPGRSTLVAQATDGTTATFVVEIERAPRKTPRARQG